MLAVVINPSCPWYGMYESFGPPNVQWCEEIICSFINNPANTWTNIAYIIFGLWVLKIGSDDKRFTKLYAFALIFTGLVSGFYHATNNYLTQFFDFVGMFTLVGSIIVFNIKRQGITKEFSLKIYYTLVSVLSASFFFAHYLFPVQFMIAIAVVVIILQEILIYRKFRATKDLKMFITALLTLGFAETMSIIDLKRIWCEPTNHIILQGHAIWHLSAALGLFFYFLFARKNV